MMIHTFTLACLLIVEISDVINLAVVDTGGGDWSPPLCRAKLRPYMYVSHNLSSASKELLKCVNRRIKQGNKKQRPESYTYL